MKYAIFALVLCGAFFSRQSTAGDDVLWVELTRGLDTKMEAKAAPNDQTCSFHRFF